MYTTNEFTKIAPRLAVDEIQDIYAPDVLPFSGAEVVFPDPVPSPGYMGPEEVIPKAQAPLPVLMETPEVVAVETPDGGAAVEIKPPSEDGGKKILILGGVALVLYFMLK